MSMRFCGENACTSAYHRHTGYVRMFTRSQPSFALIVTDTPYLYISTGRQQLIVVSSLYIYMYQMHALAHWYM